MQKLSQENIQFIDTYLKNSEIVFADIRVEMIDHVASEIEQRINDGDSRDFYYVFKDYMVENKTTLLKNNKKFTKAVDKKIGKKILINLFSTKGLMVFLSIFFIYKGLQFYLEAAQHVWMIKNLPFIIYFFIATFYFVFFQNKKLRYSAIERTGIYFLLLYHLGYVFLNLRHKRYDFINENIALITVISTFLITLTLMIFITVFQFKKEYQSKFKSVG